MEGKELGGTRAKPGALGKRGAERKASGRDGPSKMARGEGGGGAEKRVPARRSSAPPQASKGGTKSAAKLGKPQKGRVSKKSTKKPRFEFDPSRAGEVRCLTLSLEFDREENALVSLVHKPNGTITRVDSKWSPDDAHVEIIDVNNTKIQAK